MTRVTKSDLVDTRKGAYDRVAPKPKDPMKEHTTEHAREQHGADVRAPTEPNDDSVPEGLKRERKGPYSPTRGRG